MVDTGPIVLKAAAPDGSAIDVSIEFRSEFPAVMAVRVPGWSRSFEGVDLFDCLMQLRERLERDGHLLCCQGARWNAATSGMTRQFSNGTQVYLLTAGTKPTDDDLVDTFAPADRDQVATIEDQKRRTWPLLGFGPEGPRGGG